jgi:hypothetical protein
MKRARGKAVGKEVGQPSTPSTPRGVFGLSIGNDGVDSCSADPLPARNALDAETEDIIAGIWGHTHEDENPRVEEGKADEKGDEADERVGDKVSVEDKTFDAESGTAAKNLHSRGGMPKTVSGVSETSETDSVDPDVGKETVEAREKNIALIVCRGLIGRYPDEAKPGGMLEREIHDPEYWVYRLEDAYLGTHTEEAVAAALRELRERGEI